VTEWKDRAEVQLEHRHGVKATTTPMRVWTRFYLQGRSPKEAAEQATPAPAGKSHAQPRPAGPARGGSTAAAEPEPIEQPGNLRRRPVATARCRDAARLPLIADRTQRSAVAVESEEQRTQRLSTSQSRRTIATRQIGIAEPRQNVQAFR
jgi:hypothetical protein